MKKIEKIKIGALVQSGKLLLSSSGQDMLNKFIADNEDCEISIIYDAERSRSSKQNAFFYGCLLPAIQKALILSGDTNPLLLDKEYVKQKIIKQQFLAVHEGTPDAYVRSTTDLSVKEFMTFCESCMEFLINIGGVIDDNVQNKYLEIIQKFHLQDLFDKKLSYNK